MSYIIHKINLMNSFEMREVKRQHKAAGVSSFFALIECIASSKDAQIEKTKLHNIAKDACVSLPRLQRIVKTFLELNLIQENTKYYYSTDFVKPSTKFLKNQGDNNKKTVDKSVDNFFEEEETCNDSATSVTRQCNDSATTVQHSFNDRDTFFQNTLKTENGCLIVTDTSEVINKEGSLCSNSISNSISSSNNSIFINKNTTRARVGLDSDFENENSGAEKTEELEKPEQDFAHDKKNEPQKLETATPKRCKKRVSLVFPALPVSLDSAACRDVFEKFLSHRKLRRSPFTPLSAEQLFKKYENRPEDFCRDVKNSIEKGWLGVFEHQEQPKKSFQNSNFNGSQNRNNSSAEPVRPHPPLFTKEIPAPPLDAKKAAEAQALVSQMLNSIPKFTTLN